MSCSWSQWVGLRSLLADLLDAACLPTYQYQPSWISASVGTSTLYEIPNANSAYLSQTLGAFIFMLVRTSSWYPQLCLAYLSALTHPARKPNSRSQLFRACPAPLWESGTCLALSKDMSLVGCSHPGFWDHNVSLEKHFLAKLWRQLPLLHPVLGHYFPAKWHIIGSSFYTNLSWPLGCS